MFRTTSNMVMFINIILSLKFYNVIMFRTTSNVILIIYKNDLASVLLQFLNISPF